MTEEETAMKISDIEHRAISNTRRIEKLELQTESIQRLATSVEIMVKEQGHQTEAIERIEKNVEKLDNKVEVLEKKPGKRWDSVVDKILMLLIGAVMAFLLAKLGL